MALRNKQKVFVIEYLKDFNATQAAIRAGYSPKTAYSIGQENLKKPEIAEAIRAEIETRVMGIDEVKVRIADIARGDIADLMALSSVGFSFELMIEDEHGNKIPNPKTKLIRKIRQKVTTISARNESGEDREIVETELELYSAQDALRDIAKIQGMLKDSLDVTTNGKELVNPLSDDERIARIATILDAAREKRDRQSSNGA